MIKYSCPECGGEMEISTLLTSPPKKQAQCIDCHTKYWEKEKVEVKPLPKSYVRVSN